MITKFQEFSRVENIFFQDPTPNSLSAKTKRYQVISISISATIVATGIFWFVYKTVENFSTKFQEFSRSTGKLSAFPGVFQGPGRKFQNSRSFPKIPGVVGTML